MVYCKNCIHHRACIEADAEGHDFIEFEKCFNYQEIINPLAYLKDYYFDRTVFSDTFFKIFTEDEYENMLSENSFSTDSFVFYRVGDEFYIHHLPSGTIINWYKHIGRTNTCNKQGFTIDDLICFFNILHSEFIDYWNYKHPPKPKETPTSKGIDVPSCYPSDIIKTSLNSVYGTLGSHFHNVFTLEYYERFLSNLENLVLPMYKKLGYEPLINSCKHSIDLCKEKIKELKEGKQ